MAQSAVESWITFLEAAGIPSADSATYAKLLVDNRLADHHDLTKEVLKDIGITIIGDIITIMKYSERSSSTADLYSAAEPRPLLSNRPPPLSKPPVAVAPQINAEMTHQEFRKFTWDWGVFKTLTEIPDNRIPAQIYSNCDANVQNNVP